MRLTGALVAGALLASCATPGRPTETPITEGYLSDAEIDAVAARASPPDLAVLATEAAAGAGSPDAPEDYDRWQLAIVHAELRPPEAAQHFDCALAVRFLAEPRPALTRLMARLSVDSQKVSLRAAERFKRERPVEPPHDLRPCQRTSEDMRRSPSWPASGAVVGTAYGEAFAELAPDRAEAVRRIGRAIGDSRAVCRMNWLSDVEAGAALGQALWEQAERDPALVTDLQAARAEVATARAEGLTNPACAFERRVLRPDAG